MFANRKVSISLALGAVLALGTPAATADDQNEEEVPFPVAVMIIELTEEDIEIQFFADGHWGRFEIENPNEPARGRDLADAPR